VTERGLLVVGDVVTDVVARHPAPIEPGTDTAADIVVRPGGSGANTAAWAAHLGADVRLLARAGFDTHAWHAAELVRAGVRPYLRLDPDHPTAVVIAMVDGSGERSMLTNRGAGARICPDDWTDSLLDGVGHLHVSGYTLFAEPGLRLARICMRAAVRRGLTISVDPASTGFLRTFGVARFLAETEVAGLVIPNHDEALLLCGAPSGALSGAPSEPRSGPLPGDDAARAAEALSARFGAAAVKLGERGAILAKEGRTVAGAPGAEAEVIDSTGAGDAFAAGFLTALLAGRRDGEALTAGCRAGAAAVGRLGGRPPGPSSPHVGLARKQSGQPGMKAANAANEERCAGNAHTNPR
jgi:sugar/nucleoside kinase (ribokinase family)